MRRIKDSAVRLMRARLPDTFRSLRSHAVVKVVAKGRVALAAVLVLGGATQGWADVLVDTGPGPALVSGWALHSTQGLAVQFSTADAYTLTGIEGWMVNSSLVGQISLHQDAAGVPGEQLYAAPFVIAGAGSAQPAWYGASGLSWAVMPGVYWVAFTVPAGESGYTLLPYPAQAPLPGFAIWNTFSWGPEDGLTSGIGVRVNGIPVQPRLPEFAITDVGKRYENQAKRSRLNNFGDVVSSTVPAGLSPDDDYLRAYVYHYQTGMIELIPPLEPNVEGTDPSCYGNDINDTGQVVGSCPTGQAEARPFLYGSGSIRDIGEFPTEFGIAYSINNRGEVVGYEGGPYFEQPEAFILRPGYGITYLRGEEDDYWYSEALAVNDVGQVTGYIMFSHPTAGYGYRPFLYSEGILQGIVTEPRFAYGNDINAQGDIVGWMQADFNAPVRPFLYSDGVLGNVGSLGEGAALGINDSGHIVGRSGGRGFLYRNGTVRYLNELVNPALGWSFPVADGINNRDQMSAEGRTATGESRTVLLTPIALLFDDLLAEVAGVGPGRVLTDTVTSATAYYQAGDLEETCATLDDLNKKVTSAASGKKPKISAQTASEITKDATTIQSAVGCH